MASQADPFRESDYQSLAAYVESVLEGGCSEVEELNVLQWLAICGLMFDALFAPE